MEGPQRPQSNIERRSRSNPDVFADEYATGTGAADARREYRRSQPLTSAHELSETSSLAERRSRTPSQTFLAPRSFPVNKHGERSQQEAGARNSIAKETRSSFEILNEGSTVGSRPGSLYSESPAGIQLRNRPTSNASSYYERSHSPFPTSSGPSHPYDMYPQAGVVRSPSVAGSSTSRLRPSIYTPTRPAHPYALYQQNSLPLSDDEENSPVQPAIQIGFPGRPTNYHRQIGPDGEEQYILGPDGHTEQLPPYSKYPEQGSEKTVPVPTIVTAPTVAVPSPVSPQRQNTAESQEDLISPNPNSNPQPQTPPPLAVPQPQERPRSETHSESSRSSVMTDKAWKEKTWKEKRRTRVCAGRIPIWALVLIASVILFIVIVLGGVIGGLLTAQKGEKEQPPTVTVTSTNTMFDASLIPTPTGMPPLPTGQYWLRLGIPQEQQKNCLTSADQFSSWSCNVPPPPLFVDVHQPPAGFSIIKMWGSELPLLPDGSKPRFNYTYGAQPPRVQPMQRLYWVSDLEEPARGPALHFQTNYDKLVILNPSEFAAGKKYRQRRATANTPNPDGQTSPPGPPPPRLLHTLKTGDQPWFCFWNQTFIEGFVYMAQNSTSPPGHVSGLLSPSPTVSSNAAASYSYIDLARSSSPTTPQLVAANYLNSGNIRPEDQAQSTHKKRMAATAAQTVTVPGGPLSAAASASAAAASFAAASGSSASPSPTGPLPNFPFIMKLEERRVPNPAIAVQPYCLRMIVPPEGQPVPMTDDDGNPIRVNLLENDPSPSDFSTAFGPKKTAAATSTGSQSHQRRRDEAQLRQYFERNDPPKSCHCLWVSQ